MFKSVQTPPEGLSEALGTYRETMGCLNLEGLRCLYQVRQVLKTASNTAKCTHLLFLNQNIVLNYISCYYFSVFMLPSALMVRNRQASLQHG